ncbi:hypothetical protein GGR53DRAFT_250066 [Hypoxylon sp. FL1150]|nr:hypothetical protein GGR53DRAFT_250066 [Hypoxylon sp. FL1150]
MTGSASAGFVYKTSYFTYLYRLRPVSRNVSNHGFVAQDVGFSGLNREIHRTDMTEEKLIGDKMKWSPIYSCIISGERFKETSGFSYLSTSSQLVAPPQLVVFGIESPARRKQYYSVISRDERYIHFSVRRGQFRPGNYCLDYIRLQSEEDRNAENPGLRQSCWIRLMSIRMREITGSSLSWSERTRRPRPRRRWETGYIFL